MSGLIVFVALVLLAAWMLLHGPTADAVSGLLFGLGPFIMGYSAGREA